MLSIKLMDLLTGKEFRKDFKNENEFYKFKRKLRYSKKLIEMKEWE